MRPKNRHTTPPKVLPLLPIAFIAIWVGYLGLGVAYGVLALIGVLSVEDATAGDAVLTIVGSVVPLVALSFVLRWLVEWWVGKYPPRPGPRHAVDL